MKKRTILVALPVWLLLVGLLSVGLAAADHPVNVTPDEAIHRLVEGNLRFSQGKSVHPNAGSAGVVETATNGQHPFAAILSCSDSRVPLEILFDQGIGDIFAVRVAGNVCGVDEMGSIEYAVEHVGTPLFLVLGHTECGAVKAAASKAETHGNIKLLVDKVGPAVARAAVGAPGSARHGPCAGGHGSQRMALDRGTFPAQSHDAPVRAIRQAQGRCGGLRREKRADTVAR